MGQKRKRTQMQYFGWSSEAEVASLDKWTSGDHLDETIRRIRERELGSAEKLAYAKKLLRELKCFSFSRTKRFRNVWAAVNLCKGDIKSELDKVESLADKVINAANDTRIGDNDNDRGFGSLLQRLRAADDAYFDVLDIFLSIQDSVFGCYGDVTSREDLEKELGLTWKAGKPLEQ